MARRACLPQAFSARRGLPKGGMPIWGSIRKDSKGQSLVETALMIPLMLILALNALNLGYFFFVTVNLAATTRTGAEYAVIGPGSPSTTSYASANTGSLPVTALIYQD